MADPGRIVVGLSGGVDSAVAALLLRRRGHDVHGLHMTNWDEADAYCTAAADYQAARRVAAALDIPLHRADFSADYRSRVFADFLAQYAAGRTPNPDVLCNRYIKFGAFAEHARRLGASHIATGHYARTDGTGRLLRAVDAAKDQTYFLHAIERDALLDVLFPLGELTKAEVRRIANDAGLPNHDRPDSTGICFIGERPFREFLARYLRGAPGPVETPGGERVGSHEGLMFHTLGQRAGLRIGGVKGAPEEPWYVAAKDAARNALVVVQGRGHPLLWSQTIRTGQARWLRPPGPGELRCEARVRHRHAPAPCTVSPRGDGSLAVRFDEPVWAPAPGQYVVFYSGDECLGGAVIEYNSAAPSTSPASLRPQLHGAGTETLTGGDPIADSRMME